MTQNSIDPFTDVAPREKQKLVLVTGPSGAGRSTAIHALEDIGFEVIDNLPLSLLTRLLEGPPVERPVALGIDVRNRDFSVDALNSVLDSLHGRLRIDAQLLFLDCSEDVLMRRYSETRRRHPLTPDDAPQLGIAREKELLIPIRGRADLLIETSALSPHDLRAEIETLFAPEGSGRLAITVQSFSYKRGLPRGADLVFDCRFLQNPHWVPELRKLDGRSDAVAHHVEADSRYAPFFEQLLGLSKLLLPAYQAEGKSHLSIAFGCTGGQHRSVALTENLAKALAEDGWQVSKRHRELERRSVSALA